MKYNFYNNGADYGKSLDLNNYKTLNDMEKASMSCFEGDYRIISKILKPSQITKTLRPDNSYRVMCSDIPFFYSTKFFLIIHNITIFYGNYNSGFRSDFPLNPFWEKDNNNPNLYNLCFDEFADSKIDKDLYNILYGDIEKNNSWVNIFVQIVSNSFKYDQKYQQVFNRY